MLHTLFHNADLSHFMLNGHLRCTYYAFRKFVHESRKLQEMCHTCGLIFYPLKALVLLFTQKLFF